MRILVSTWLGLAATLWTLDAAAWTESDDFDAPAEDGGGGGLSFTGSDAALNLHCGHCHIGAPGRIGAVLSSRPDLARGYAGTDFFRFTVRIEGEHAGLERACDPQADSSCNLNGFALEVTDGRGDGAGQLCTVEPDDGVCPDSFDAVVDLTGGRRVARPRPDTVHDTEWTVFWLPPADPDVEVHVWASVVDGNGGDGTFDVAPSDLFGDDVALTDLTARARATDGGCRAVPGGASAGTSAVLLVAVLLVVLRRRARVVAFLALGACAPDPPPTPAPDETMFDTQVGPLLRETCTGPACHEGPRPAGNLALDSLAGLQARVDAVLPYGPYLDGLLLLKTLTFSEQGSGLRIPHAGVLLPSRNDERFLLLQRWIAAGAPPLEPQSIPTPEVRLQPEEPPTREGEPSPDDVSRFEADVEPSLQTGCTGLHCHSGSGGALWIRKSGDEHASQNLLDVAAFIARGEEPRMSPIVRKLVPAWRGGLTHGGGSIFDSLDEALASPIGQWVTSQVGDPLPDTRSAGEQYFEDEVQPVLVNRGCLFQNCHGVAHFSDLRLDPGVRGSFTRAQTNANYLSAAAQLALGRFPDLSRLVRKPSALDAGGIDHLAFPMFTAADDPDLDVLRAWIGLETEAQEERRGLPAGAIGLVTGVVWVDAPPFAYPVRDPDASTYGSQLMWAPVDVDAEGRVTGLAGAPEELSSDLRAGRDADIRSPTVSYDGARVVFSARFDGEDRLLYSVDLETQDVVRLTEPDPGCLTLDSDPTFTPDGQVVFVSTRACQQTARGQASTHLFAIDGAGGDPVQITFGPFQVYAPTSNIDGKIHFSQWRGLGEQTPLFRVLPDGFEPRDHLGNRVSPEAILLGARPLPDGREVLTRVTPGAAAPVGELMLFSRSFGPPGDDPYRPRSFATTGISGAQQAAPLPDGRMLVARTPARVNALEVEPGAIDLGLYVDTLEGGTLHRGTALVDRAGRWEMWPAVVAARAEPFTPPVSPERGEQSQIVFHSFAVADSLFITNERVPATLDPRVEGIRILEALPVPLGSEADEAHPEPIHRRISEVALESDRSVAVDVPSDRPLRFQSLDASGLALNEALWHQAVRPGATINQNVPPRFFGSFCGGCHGPREQAAALVPPVTVDTVSGASLSVAKLVGPRAVEPDDDILGFREDVWPILEERCAGCHGGEGAGLELGDDPEAAYETLIARHPDDEEDWAWVDTQPGLARRSYMVEVLRGEELDSPRELSAVPHPTVELAEDELTRITLWIDLGASRSSSY